MEKNILNCVNRLAKLIQERLRMPYYAVAKGRQAGVFSSWGDCERQVKGFSGACYKKFNTEQEALRFIQDNSDGFGGSSSNVRPNHSTFSAVSTRINTISKVKNSSVDSSISCKNQIKESCTSSKDTSFNIDDLEDPFEINEAVSKQLDTLENRLQGITENVENIYDKFGKIGGKRTLPTEPHHMTKRRRSGDGKLDADDKKYIQVYTDGACSSNGQIGARAGYGVWWGVDHPLNESGSVERATNNSGEIRAAVRACELAKENGVEKLCINTDSKFLINSITKWLPGWKKNNWQLKSGGRVKNQEDFEALERASRGLDVRYCYVEAHKGVQGNECADELARRGASGK